MNRDAHLAEIWAHRKRDEALLVRELRDAGFNVESVYDFVNTREEYPSAIPILIRHLEIPHDPVIRQGIIRSLTIKYGGREVEEALLKHFYGEQIRETKWTLANALKTAMPYHRRKKLPEIAAIFSGRSA